MDVKYITTTKENLDSLNIVDGQIIALSDTTGFYYDMNSTRHSVSSITVVSALPETGTENMIYIVTDGTSAQPFIWLASSSQFIALAGTSKMAEMTLAEYNALTDSQKMDGTVRYITDAGGGSGGVVIASGVTFEATSDISSTNVQAAIVEVQGHLTSFEAAIAAYTDKIDTYTNGIGTSDIKSVGDGTLTGAIRSLHNATGFTGTSAQAQAAIEAGTITDGMIVNITDDYDDGTVTADHISYDNSTSGLSATAVQGAIDEVNSTLSSSYQTRTDGNLATSSKTVVGAINEVKGGLGFTGTSAQAQAAIAGGTITDGMLVNITDDYTDGSIAASQVSYDDSASGIGATAVQGAIAQLNSTLTGLYQTKTDANLATSAKTIVSAINEVNEDLTENASLETTSKSMVGAINEINTNLSKSKVYDSNGITVIKSGNVYTVDCAVALISEVISVINSLGATPGDNFLVHGFTSYNGGYYYCYLNLETRGASYLSGTSFLALPTTCPFWGHYSFIV